MKFDRFITTNGVTVALILVLGVVLLTACQSQRLKQAYLDREENNRRFGESLINSINSGLNGKLLRYATNTYTKRRCVAFHAVFNHEDIYERVIDEIHFAQDYLAEEFYCAAMQDTAENGMIDFDVRDLQRANVLTRADELGVSRKYITDRGEGTYRGGRFDDPVVRAVVEGYEDDMERVREYYNTTRVEFEKYGLGDLYLDFIGSSDPDFSMKNPQAKLPLIMAGVFRQQMEFQDAELSRILWRWGFIDKPTNPEVLLEVNSGQFLNTPSAEFDRRQLAPAR